MTAILAAKNISVQFAGNYGVRDVSLQVDGGSVLCLLGDNGAGKSTLIKVLSGVYQPSEGQLQMDGEVVTFGTPKVAREAGISTVHQYGGTAPLMSVDRNFFVGSEPTKSWGPIRVLDRTKMRKEALRAIAGLGLTRVTDARQLVGTMSGGERQALAIARAVYFGARVLILDEPTSALGVKEAAFVLKLIAQVRDAGVAVVFITHNAHHALAIGNQFQVLINGRTAATFAKGEKSRIELLDLMAGGEEFTSIIGDIESLSEHSG